MRSTPPDPRIPRGSRERFSLSSVLGAGLLVVLVYVVGRVVFHITKGLLEILVPLLVAGFVVQAVPRGRRVPGWLPLALGVAAFVAVLAGERQLGLR